ncbi:Reverse Transcriptase, partial [Cladosporium fulvum T-1 virus]
NDRYRIPHTVRNIRIKRIAQHGAARTRTLLRNAEDPGTSSSTDVDTERLAPGSSGGLETRSTTFHIRTGKRINSPGMSDRRELCNTEKAQASPTTTVFRTKIIVNGHKTDAMIDSGASGNFASESFVTRNRIATCKKKEGYELIAVDGSSLPSVERETIPLPLAIQRHHEEITLDVTDMASHDIVLGMPWLRKHNPVIDWRRGVLTFRECECVIDIQPAQWQRSLADEARKQLNRIQLAPTRRTEEPPSTGTDTGVGPPGHEVTGSDGSNAPSKDTNISELSIPKEYRKWSRLFEEERGKDALPKHQPWDHKINIQPGKEPPWGPLYQMSEKELQTLREWLKEKLAKGWIRRSTSSAGTPCMFVPKANGKLRLVQDYRKLNEITIKNRYPLPNIEEAQDRLTGSDWYTKIDLRDAFYAIRMAEGEEWKTAFRTRYGLYEFLVMPMGLTNAPASCQDLVNETLRDLLDVCVVAYMDDILVYTKGSLQEHTKQVQDVFERLTKSGFKTAPEKCEFHKKEVKFLGFIISTTGITIDPAKTQSIREWPEPKTVKDVQSFLGLANYNRKFIKDYSKTAAPMTMLTRKDVNWKWGKEQTEAFKRLKEQCASAPTLRLFDGSKEVHIETDASDMAIGACLTQTHDGKRHPVAYYSRKMTTAEQNYDIHDKELLAIVAAMQHWRVYVEGPPKLTILSDHKNLTYFTTTKELTRRQARWSELLGQYKFEIKYTPGTENGPADALSRRSDYMEGKEPVQHKILKTNPDGSLSANTREFNNIVRILSDKEEQFPISQGKYQVPKDREEECIRQHHDEPTYGHPGTSKTVDLIQRSFSFPQMRLKVLRYIKKCVHCQQNKAARHAKYGHLQFRTPPTKPWDEVTMDFITKLPRSKDRVTGQAYDMILVMVDRLTKYAHFIPASEIYTAEQLGYLVLDRLIRYHGFPEVFITDRDKLFTSNYWKTLMGTIGIKHKLSTAYHPETDGQTERTNQTLEQYLRHYINYAQDNWVSLLPMAQIALNNHKSETTSTTPFMRTLARTLTYPEHLDPTHRPREQS